MDIAKSMYLWGSVIEPHDCDYDDTRELGLTCIYCSQPVFLVKGKSFTNSHGTPINVKPYFSHYRKSNEADLCEARCVSPEGRELKNFAVGEPRNQRLHLYHQHFAKIIKRGVTAALIGFEPRAAWLPPKLFRDALKIRHARTRERYVKLGWELAKEDGVLTLIEDFKDYALKEAKEGVGAKDLIIYSEIVNYIVQDKSCEALSVFMAASCVLILFLRRLDSEHVKGFTEQELIAPTNLISIGLYALIRIKWLSILDPNKLNTAKGFGKKALT